MIDLTQPRTLELPRGVSVGWFPRRSREQPPVCTSVFGDGATVTSIPHPGDVHYCVISHRCGYGDDVDRYCLEHDVAHHLVAHWLQDAESAVLAGLARRRPLTGRQAAYEEMMAQAFQRWLRANEQPIVGGARWHDWKAEALALLDAA